MQCSCPLELVFQPRFLNIVVKVNGSGHPHVVKLWLGICEGMLPVKCFRSSKAFIISVEFHGDHETVTMLRCIWLPSVLRILPDLKQWCLSVYINSVPAYRCHNHITTLLCGCYIYIPHFSNMITPLLCHC